MALQCINAILGCFRLSKPHVVGNDYPELFRQGSNHIAVEVTPGGLTVQTKNDLSLGRPLIDVVLTKPSCISEMWFEGPRTVKGFVRVNHSQRFLCVTSVSLGQKTFYKVWTLRGTTLLAIQNLSPRITIRSYPHLTYYKTACDPEQRLTMCCADEVF